MHPTRTSSHHQQRRVQHLQSTSDSYRFFNLLTSDELLGKVEDLLPPHRERRYPPTETLSMFLAQGMNADRSCQHIVNQGAVRRLTSGFSATSTHKIGRASCRERARGQADAEQTTE